MIFMGKGKKEHIKEFYQITFDARKELIKEIRENNEEQNIDSAQACVLIACKPARLQLEKKEIKELILDYNLTLDEVGEAIKEIETELYKLKYNKTFHTGVVIAVAIYITLIKKYNQAIAQENLCKPLHITSVSFRLLVRILKYNKYIKKAQGVLRKIHTDEHTKLGDKIIEFIPIFPKYTTIKEIEEALNISAYMINRILKKREDQFIYVKHPQNIIKEIDKIPHNYKLLSKFKQSEDFIS